MCKWGTEVLMDVMIPDGLSHSGEAYVKRVGIDACIAPIVKALNEGGVLTSGSCCGHGRDTGSIMLQDGRVLMVVTEDAACERGPLNMSIAGIVR